MCTPQKYSRVQRRILATKLPHPNQTVEELAQKITDYTMIQSHEARVLRTIDRARYAQLLAWRQENPNVTIIDGPVPDLGPRGKGINEYDDKPDELWRLLRQYDDILSKKPVTLEIHFARSTYAFSAMILLEQYVYHNLRDVRGFSMAWEKRLGEMQAIAMRKMRSELDARGFGTRKESKKPESPSAAALRRARAGPSLPQPVHRATSRASSSSPGNLSQEAAARIAADVDRLTSSEFQTYDGVSGAKHSWKVDNYAVNCRTGEWQYGVVFENTIAGEAGKMYGRNELEALLQNSVEVIIID